MKKNICINLLNVSHLKMAVLVFSASMFLTSCVIYTGGYSETDGVYYDPNKDTLPKGYGTDYAENRVGEYYDYNQDRGIIEKNNENLKQAKNRFKKPQYSGQEATSDWGAFSGTEVNYYHNHYYNPYWYNPYWGGYYPHMFGGYWGYPWGWNSGFNFGWNNWSGWNLGFNWGWGHSWGYHNPWRYRYYDPFWGGYYNRYYAPYYYDRGYNYYPRRSSGANRLPSNNTNSYGNMRTGYENVNRQSNTYNSGGMRTPAPQRRDYNRQNNMHRQPNYDNGFRNNSNSGGFRSNGNFGGGSMGGGMRSGGGMRTGGR